MSRNSIFRTVRAMLFAAALVFVSTLPESSVFAETEAIAEKTDFAALAAGDRVYLVNEASNVTISSNVRGSRLEPASVVRGTEGGKTVLTAAGNNAVPFTLEKEADGTLYFRSDYGYLCSAETGGGLHLSGSKENCGAWSFTDGQFLFNKNAASGGSRIFYLEYYTGSSVFTTYRMTDDTAAFTVSFYKLPEQQTSSGNETAPAGTYTLPVFETSDVHGYLADTSEMPYQYRLAFISDKIRDARSTTGAYRKDRALLVDGGDIFQGNSMSNLLKGSSISAAYALMDYDAVTIGNHEFDWEIRELVEADKTMMDSRLDETPVVNSVPVVCMNLYYQRQKIDFADPYVIVNKMAADENGAELPVKIAVIGYTLDHSSSIMYTKFTGAGYQTVVNYTEVNKLAAELESSGQADATVLLVHGAAEDVANGLGRSSVVDLVLGGHTHQNVTGSTSWGLRYAQPAANATAYVETALRFTKNASGQAVYDSTSAPNTVSLYSYTSKLTPGPSTVEDLDARVVSLTNRVIEEIDEILNTVVGYITVSARRNQYIAGSGERSSPGGNFMASIIARSGDAEIGFVNGGGIRTDLVIEAGQSRRNVTLSDIYTMFPFGNLIYTFELTYEELLKAFRYSLTSGGSGLLSRVSGIDCYFVGTKVNALVKDGKTIYLNGVWKKGWAEKKVKVAVSEFVATTDRNTDNMANPFVSWAKTSRLISSETIDYEGAIRVLDEEARANDGHLFVDTAAHFLNSTYSDPSFDPNAEEGEGGESAESGTGEGGGESRASDEAETGESAYVRPTMPPAPSRGPSGSDGAAENGEEPAESGDALPPALPIAAAAATVLAAGLAVAMTILRKKRRL